MKKCFLVVLSILLCFSNSTSFVFGAEQKRMAAAWISTVYSADFPSVKNDIQAQKKEFSDKLDHLKAFGINAVIVQVRPKGDALYASAMNPWSDVLTGKQGQNPGYDPMAYMIEEAHKRGMEFHAWLNPYRVTVASMKLSDLAPNNPAVLHPDWTFAYQGAYYYNPENAEVKAYIRDTAAEIATNYAVDGIHFDDYFYPAGYPLPDGENGDGPTAQKRREHINEMVKMVSDAVHQANPNIVFGISPMGIWKNEEASAFGAKINGSAAYYTVYADAKAWVEQGSIDYLVPQVYWETGNRAADYHTLIKFWADMVKGSKVKLYIGEGIYKDIVAKEISSHLQLAKQIPEIAGHFFFSARDLWNNRQGAGDVLKDYMADYAERSIGGVGDTLQTGTGVTDGSKENQNTETTGSAGKVPGQTGTENEGEAPEAQNTIQEENTANIGQTEKGGGDAIQKPAGVKAEAIYSTAKLRLNGKEVKAEAYTIDGYNYFKLRDIAALLAETGSRFDLVWKEDTEKIEITKNTAYQATGDEMLRGDGRNKTAVSQTAVITIAGEDIPLAAYTIADYTYLKLRDLGEAIAFGVVWNEEERAVELLTPEF